MARAPETLFHSPGVGLLGSYWQGDTETLTPEALSLEVPQLAAHEPSAKTTSATALPWLLDASAGAAAANVAARKSEDLKRVMLTSSNGVPAKPVRDS